MSKTSIRSGSLMDEYTLGKLVGQGSYGKVYLATKKRTKTPVIIKVVSVRRLYGDNVQRIWDLSKEITEDGKNCNAGLMCYEDVFMDLAMKSWIMVLHPVKGRNLFSILECKYRPSDLPPADFVASIFSQLIHVLAFLEKKGIRHRDLKAENIIYDPESGSVTVIDYDMLCEYGKCTTDTEFGYGTKFFSSPNFIINERNEDNDYPEEYMNKADVWAVGITMYELLLHKEPFVTPDDMKTISPSVVKALPKNATPGHKKLASLIDKALITDDKKRYSATKLEPLARELTKELIAEATSTTGRGRGAKKGKKKVVGKKRPVKR